MTLSTRFSRFFTALLLAACVAAAQSPSFQYFYDDAGQLIRVIDSSGNVLDYSYDPSGNITAIQRSTIAPGSLAIFGYSPANGPAGTQITIRGQGFSTTPANNIVKFNGIVATVLTATANTLIVIVPAGATAGPITVTVGANTTSSSSNFNSAPSASITSVTPDGAIIGTNIPNVAVQGSGLNNATFDLGLGGSVNSVVSSTASSATLNVTAGQTPGVFALSANSNAGLSSATPDPGNHFIVMYSPNEAGLSVSVLNIDIPPSGLPGLPAGYNEASKNVSLLNVSQPPTGLPGLPPGATESSLNVSVLNANVPLTGLPDLPAGSNETDSAVTSVKQTAPGPPPAPSTVPHITVSSTESGALPGPAGESLSMAAGQTLRLAVAGLRPEWATQVEWLVNGIPFSRSLAEPYEFLFTAPASVEEVNITARGANLPRLATTIKISPDRVLSLAGRVVAPGGSPAKGAAIDLIASGLRADFFHLDPGVNALPELAAAKPAFSNFVTAVNFPNPQAVFGNDPLGARIPPDSAIRLTGRIHAEMDGDYAFYLSAHATATLRIDGKQVTTLRESGPEASEAMGALSLKAGWHDIEIVQLENVGASALQLSWVTPRDQAAGGLRKTVPPEALQSPAGALRAIAADNGEFFIQGVPGALTGLRFRAALGALTGEAPALPGLAAPTILTLDNPVKE